MLKANIDGNLEYKFLKELDKLDSAARLVRALHRNHMATGSIPARAPVVAFLRSCFCLVKSKMMEKIYTRDFDL